jgi:hypothetical protein
MVSELCCALDGIGEVIGFSRETVVIIVKWRSVLVNDGPFWFFPMSGEEDDGLGLRILLLYLLKLLIEDSMLFLVDEGHGASTVSDKNRCHCD